MSTDLWFAGCIVAILVIMSPLLLDALRSASPLPPPGLAPPLPPSRVAQMPKACPHCGRAP